MSAGVIDFHVHYTGDRWKPRDWAEGGDPRFVRIAERIVDLRDVLAPIENGDFSARVLSAPVSLVAGARKIAAEEITDINNHLISVLRDHSSSLLGLATIDLWNESAEREIQRVFDLGLTGVVVDAANMQTGAFADQPELIPVWRKLRDLGLSVFFHPVSLPGVIKHFSGSRSGVLLARGAVDAASILALVDSPQWSELRDLNVVIPGIAASAYWFAPYFSGLAETLIQESRIYIDTMGFDPINTRYLFEKVGADRLVFGSDAPIVEENPVSERLVGKLREAGLTDSQVQRITTDNARHLLKAA